MTTASVHSLGLEVADPALETGLLAILDGVEERIHEVVRSADPLVASAATHLTDAGGKRFRPMLVALAAQFGGGPAGGDGAGRQFDAARRAEVIDAAVVVELTHLASLYHDDVMDEASIRRGAVSANARWGNSVAILVGDYLFSRAATVAAGLGPVAVKIQADTFARLVHGQIAETIGPRGTDPIAHHLHVITEKTGSLIATSARFGAMFGGAGPEHVASLAQYGQTIGIAFQLSDDLLDIVSEEEQSGKTPGTDLREGVPTLATLYALAGDDADPAAARLRALLSRGAVSDDALHAETLRLLRESSALKQARATVRWYAESARADLAGLPAGPARHALESMCTFITDRTS